jgi:hypothetical protein
MNRHATLVDRRAWRLILAVATNNDDARRTLAREIGEDIDAWYQLALVTGVQVAQLLNAEYLAAEAMRSFVDNPDLARPETEEQALALIMPGPVRRRRRARTRFGVRRARRGDQRVR